MDSAQTKSGAKTPNRLHSFGPKVVASTKSSHSRGYSLARLISKTIHTPDGPLAYTEAGSGDKEPLLLVHGGFGAANHWLKNQAFFAAHYRTLAVDLPAFGESYAPPKPHTAASVTEGIGRLLDGLGIEECACVAFSFGATMSVTYCQENASRFRKLVLLGPGGLGITGDVKLGDERRATREMSPKEKHEVFVHNQKALMFKNPACADEAYLSRAWANLKNSRMNIYAMNREPYLPDLLAACSMPLLILWGDADVIAYPTPEERRSACQKAAPHAELDIIPDAGHMAQWEQPDVFSERVLKFLRP